MPNPLWKRRPAAAQLRRGRRRSGSGGMCVERAHSDPTGKAGRGHTRRLSGDAHTTMSPARSSAPEALPSPSSLDHVTIVVALRASPPTQNKKTAQAHRPRIDTKAVVYGGIDRPYVDLTGMRNAAHPPPAWQGENAKEDLHFFKLARQAGIEVRSVSRPGLERCPVGGVRGRISAEAVLRAAGAEEGTFLFRASNGVMVLSAVAKDGIISHLIISIDGRPVYAEDFSGSCFARFISLYMSGDVMREDPNLPKSLTIMAVC